MDIQKLIKARFEKVIAGQKSEDGEFSLDVSKIDLKRISMSVGTAALSFILGSAGTAFSSYPLGLAFLSVTDRYAVSCYIGLIISALGNRGYSAVMCAVYTVVLMLRYSLGKLFSDDIGSEKGKSNGYFFGRLKKRMRNSHVADRPFSENLLIRCSVACFAAFVFGLYRLIAGGFLYYDLFGLLAGFILTPLSAFAVSGLFCENVKFEKAKEASLVALMFIAVFSLRNHTVLGFSPGFMAAMFATLTVASVYGSFRGCTAGLLTGLACGGINILGESGTYALTYSVGAAPCILAAAGVCAGSLFKFSRAAAVFCSFAVSLVLSLFVDGYTILPRIVPDLAVTFAVFIPMFKFGFLPKVKLLFTPEKDIYNGTVTVLEKKQADMHNRMSALSEAFAKLSETVYSLSDRVRRPGAVDLREICTAAFDGCCKKCAVSQICWERDCSSTLDAQSKITAALYGKGRLEFDDIPPFLRDRCPNMGLIIDEINSSCGQLIESLIKNDKTEAFALDYEAMSKLLAQQIECGETEYMIDAEKTKDLRQTLRHLGISPDRAICYGTRRKRVVANDIELARVKIGVDEIRKAIENTLEIPMGTPRFDIIGDTVSMTLDARRCFVSEVAKASSIKEYEAANGDSAAVFENNEDYFYAIISDGMGSGKEAAVTSKICAVFLERMLRAGNGKAVTLEMLNGFLKSRSAECSATIDLAEIDLISGEACFVKSGAAPSFVLRGGNLYKLESKTVPIGIMNELDAEKIKFSLEAGDVIVMLSDGIAESLEDGVWLANLLTYEWEDHLGKMAEKILDNAAISNRRSDDMTVVLIRITENTEK